MSIENAQTLLNEGIDLLRRRLVIVGEVSERMLQRTIIGLESLEQLSSDPITIILSSEGGDVHEGYGVYDRIKQSPCKITIEAIGCCKSMATVILQAADIRLISPNLRFMIHSGSIEISGNTKDVIKQVQFERLYDSPLVESIYLDRIRAKNKRFKKSMLDEFLATDTYLLPETVVSLNLADGFIKGGKKE